MPPRLPDQLIGKSQRQIGQGTDVDRDDAELLGAVPLDRMAEHAEAGIVDDIFDLDAFGGKRGGNLVAGIGLFEIAGDDDRRAPPPGGDFARQRREAIGAARHQRQAMTVGAKTRASSVPMPAEAPVISVTRSVTIRNS